MADDLYRPLRAFSQSLPATYCRRQATPAIAEQARLAWRRAGATRVGDWRDAAFAGTSLAVAADDAPGLLARVAAEFGAARLDVPAAESLCVISPAAHATRSTCAGCPHRKNHAGAWRRGSSRRWSEVRHAPAGGAVVAAQAAAAPSGTTRIRFHQDGPYLLLVDFETFIPGARDYEPSVALPYLLLVDFETFIPGARDYEPSVALPYPATAKAKGTAHPRAITSQASHYPTCWWWTSRPSTVRGSSSATPGCSPRSVRRSPPAIPVGCARGRSTAFTSRSRTARRCTAPARRPSSAPWCSSWRGERPDGRGGPAIAPLRLSLSRSAWPPDA